MIIPGHCQDLVKKNIINEYPEPYSSFGMRKDGSEFPIEIEARNFDYRGERFRVTSFRDLTNKVRVEESLKSALKLNQLQGEVPIEKLIGIGLEETIRVTQSNIGFFHLITIENNKTSLTTWLKELGKPMTVQGITSIISDKNRFWREYVLQNKPFLENKYTENSQNIFSDIDMQINNLIIIPITDTIGVKAILGAANSTSGYSKADLDQLSLLGENLWIIANNKMAENNLKESEKQLKDAVAAKDKFLSIIAHDLKSPFSALVGLTELLWEKHNKMNPDSREEIIKSIHSSTLKTYNLLENLLAWSAMHTGRKKIEPVGFILEDTIVDIIELFNEVIKRKKISLLFNNDSKTHVFADVDMINTIIRNLLSNAIKYTYSNGSISIIIEQHSAETVKITIKDSGIGISVENIEKLFKLDSNFSTPGIENEAGTGLGLILCKEFVEKNGGQIWVSSKAGSGTEFSFTVPA